MLCVFKCIKESWVCLDAIAFKWWSVSDVTFIRSCDFILWFYHVILCVPVILPLNRCFWTIYGFGMKNEGVLLNGKKCMCWKFG
jgi:nitrate reductase NapE component